MAACSISAAMAAVASYTPSLSHHHNKTHLPLFSVFGPASSSLSTSPSPLSKLRPPKNLSLATHRSPLLSSLFSFSSSSLIQCLVSAGGSDPESEFEEEEDGIEEGEGDDEYEEESEAEGSRLYVGNLPFSMTSSQLAEIFQEAGTVENVEIIYDRVTDRSRGFSFVTMGSVEEAKKAIQMFDGSQVGGRSVRVNFPEVPRGKEREVLVPRIRSSYRGYVDSPYKVYAGNLGWSLTSEALREAFADQPGLLGAKVIYDRTTGRSRGFGFISFASTEDAQAAVDAMNGVEVAGRPLRLNLAEQRASVAAPSSMQMEAEASVGG